MDTFTESYMYVKLAGWADQLIIYKTRGQEWTKDYLPNGFETNIHYVAMALAWGTKRIELIDTVVPHSSTSP